MGWQFADVVVHDCFWRRADDLLGVIGSARVACARETLFGAASGAAPQSNNPSTHAASAMMATAIATHTA